MNKNSKIYIAGHRGMVGSAILRKLKSDGYTNLITRTRQELDLLDQSAVRKFYEQERPEYVFIAAAKVGGILANNTYRAQFIYENLQIQNNLIHFAHEYGVKKLLFLGSSCIYPKFAPQPIKEEYLLTGELEPTNEPYAIAKIAGIKMCEAYRDQYGDNFISVMPTNLYGPNDNFDLETSHVLPALIRKFHLARCLENKDFDAIRADFEKFPIHSDNKSRANSHKTWTEEEIVSILEKYGICDNLSSSVVSLKLWGSGSPKREFLHVDDLADACVYLMNTYDEKQFVNIGVGEDLSIKELAERIKNIVGFTGEIDWDTTKPDGTPRKLLDVSRLHSLGWQARIPLEEGIRKTYEWYLKG
ncbi:MAG: GDP-L-fucose synthase [Methanobacteriota archaeon]|nr:MAG: GDP-L-fucose synthase [Euryarchaeota archaeon]